MCIRTKQKAAEETFAENHIWVWICISDEEGAHDYLSFFALVYTVLDERCIDLSDKTVQKDKKTSRGARASAPGMKDLNNVNRPISLRKFKRKLFESHFFLVYLTCLRLCTKISTLSVESNIWKSTSRSTHIFNVYIHIERPSVLFQICNSQAIASLNLSPFIFFVYYILRLSLGNGISLNLVKDFLAVISRSLVPLFFLFLLF